VALDGDVTDLSKAAAAMPATDLPRATIHGAPTTFRVRPKHFVVLFSLLSLVGVYRVLIEYTLYFPPLGLLFDIAWLGPGVLVIARKRITTMIGLLCLFAFIGQAFVFDEFEALSRLQMLKLTELATTFGILGGLITSAIAIVKPDPDPDFVPNEFTIR
jgi:hypothetical protein